MQTFPKSERLCNKLLIDKLIQKGNSFNGFPFKIKWLELEESSVPVKIMISVPKRKFKRAVDRNRLKRLIREAYRKNKYKLLDRIGSKKFAILVVYTAATIADYTEIEKKIDKLLVHLGKEINPEL